MLPILHILLLRTHSSVLAYYYRYYYPNTVNLHPTEFTIKVFVPLSRHSYIPLTTYGTILDASVDSHPTEAYYTFSISYFSVLTLPC